MILLQESYVPLLDMKESCHIMRQLLDKIPESGEVRANCNQILKDLQEKHIEEWNLEGVLLDIIL